MLMLTVSDEKFYLYYTLYVFEFLKLLFDIYLTIISISLFCFQIIPPVEDLISEH